MVKIHKERQKNMKIAIVDDSMSVRMMISISLEELGVQDDEVVEFMTAIEALDDFSTNYYDLIFCDLHMPKMSGFELIEKISTDLTHLKKSKIIMVTGEENIKYKEKFKKLGVHNFIKKPIHPPVFMHHIKPLIEKIQRTT
jgi:CheY-like chemotaxis protein